MMLHIKDYVFGLPALKDASNNVLSMMELTIKQYFSSMQSQESISEQEIKIIEQQFQKLIHLLNTPAKIQILKDTNHRALILSFIKQKGIQHYKYSYYNRAKVTKGHISRLEKVGPIIFSQAVMLACKINLINKNSSRIFIEDHLYTQSQNPIDMKIQQILKLCDDKKRNVNNNLKKLELILEGDDYLEVVMELGKMLRDSWKKDKVKTKCSDFVKLPMKHYYAKNEEEKRQNKNKSQAAEENDVQKKVEINQQLQIDRFSFTSSQQELIQQQKQHVKSMSKEELFILDYEDSDFANKSQLFSKFSQPEFL